MTARVNGDGIFINAVDNGDGSVSGKVIAADNAATNGVVHIIDAVLMPNDAPGPDQVRNNLFNTFKHTILTPLNNLLTHSYPTLLPDSPTGLSYRTRTSTFGSVGGPRKGSRAFGSVVKSMRVLACPVPSSIRATRPPLR